MRSTVLPRLPVATGLLVLASAALLALLPMRGNGLSGNAVLPHYGTFGWYVASSQPVPAHPTPADLRRLGVRFPQDLVRSRRYLVGAVGATGLAATAVGLLIRRRHDAGAEGSDGGDQWPS